MLGIRFQIECWLSIDLVKQTVSSMVLIAKHWANVAEPIRRILVAHELGHDRLHKKMAMLKGFQEVELFDKTIPAEYEANIFAAELMIADNEVLELLNDED